MAAYLESNNEFEDFEESEESEEEEDDDEDDDDVLISSLPPISAQPHSSSSPSSFTSHLPLTSTGARFSPDPAPLDSPFSITLNFQSSEPRGYPGILDCESWFVVDPASRDNSTDLLLDSCEIGPFTPFFPPSAGSFSNFATTLEFPGPSLAAIPHAESLECTALLIRISRGGLPCMLIPFLVAIDWNEGNPMRRLIEMKPRYDEGGLRVDKDNSSSQPIYGASDQVNFAIRNQDNANTMENSSTSCVSSLSDQISNLNLSESTFSSSTFSTSTFSTSTFSTSTFSTSTFSSPTFSSLLQESNLPSPIVDIPSSTFSVPSNLDINPFEVSDALLICAIQINSRDCKTVEDRDYNLQHAEQLIQKAHRDNGSQSRHPVLYILPELSSTGYNPDTFQLLNILAEEEQGPSFLWFSRIAASLGCFIGFGVPLKKDSQYFISHMIVSPNGKQHIYKKLHLCNYGECSETTWFSNPPFQDQFASIVKINGLRIGISICYDIRFPELFRILAVQGNCDVILHPGGWPRDSCFSTWHPFVICRAVENQCLIVSVNRAGSHFGKSIIAGPWVDDQEYLPMVGKDDEEFLWRLIHKVEVDSVRSTYRLRGDFLSSYDMLRFSTQDLD